MADVPGLDEDGRAALLTSVPRRGKAGVISSAIREATEPARSSALPDPATPLGFGTGGYGTGFLPAHMSDHGRADRSERVLRECLGVPPLE